MMTTTTQHPLQAGEAARAWWLVETVTRLAMWATWGLGMYAFGTDRVAEGLVAIVAYIALFFLAGRLGREAWSFVPGAFAWRSVLRGDIIDTATSSAGTARRWAESAVMIVLAYVVLAHLSDYGQAGVGLFLAFTAGGSFGLFAVRAFIASAGRTVDVVAAWGPHLSTGVGLSAALLLVDLPLSTAFYAVPLMVAAGLTATGLTVFRRRDAWS